LRRKLKEKKLKKKLKKKKGRAPTSSFETDFEKKKKASDDAKTKSSAPKQTRLLATGVALRVDERDVRKLDRPRAGTSPPRRRRSLLGRAPFRRRVTPADSPRFCRETRGNPGGVLAPTARKSPVDGLVDAIDPGDALARSQQESLDESWGNLEDVIEQVMRKSLGESDFRDFLGQAGQEPLDESWGNLGDVLEQAKRQSLGESDLADILGQAGREPLDESWGDLGDVLEQAQRDSLHESWGNLRGALEFAKQDSLFSLPT